MPVELSDAILQGQSGVVVTLGAPVLKVLRDDNEGSRHQRLLLALPEPIDGFETVLVAHNIDIAPRIPCGKGDTITVRGQYEWNDLGGVIHWTHRDADGEHEGGWIEFEGKRYD